MSVTPIEKVLYTARAHTTGGREGGASATDDGHLSVKITPPGHGDGTNPEQLFAAGWSTCFLSALKIVLAKKKIALPEGTAIDAEVDLGTNSGGYQLQGRLKITLPGVEREVAKELAMAAHGLCPYSKATSGNIDVTITVA